MNKTRRLLLVTRRLFGKTRRLLGETRRLLPKCRFWCRFPPPKVGREHAYADYSGHFCYYSCHSHFISYTPCTSYT